MDFAAFILTFAVLLLVGLYLYFPFLRGYGTRLTHEEHELSALMAEQDRVLSSLQELDFDYKLGKIPEAEYPIQRNNLLQKGTEVMRKIDALQETYSSIQRDSGKSAQKLQKKSNLTDEALESMILARRRVHKSSFDGFCPKCGKPVMASDRFCPSCGKALKP
jgi:NADH pyrophosphatase NudC (nudix superfamily)